MELALQLQANAAINVILVGAAFYTQLTHFTFFPAW
eukprot:COSAG05_NODE_3199_length_2251_cov_1.328067_2_plen_36_part_00